MLTKVLHNVFGVGILIPEDDRLICKRKARRMDRKYPASYMLLMMFRSMARDERKEKHG